MIKKKHFSVYYDFKTGFFYKIFLLLGGLLLIIFIFIKIISFIMDERSSSFIQFIHNLSNSNTTDSIIAFSIIFLGIGIILFVASNWSKIPDFFKLILLFGTTFVLYFVGWKLKFDTKSHPKPGNALLFLASIFVGATIFLTAQIFNVKFGITLYGSGLLHGMIKKYSHFKLISQGAGLFFILGIFFLFSI